MFVLFSFASFSGFDGMPHSTVIHQHQGRWQIFVHLSELTAVYDRTLSLSWCYLRITIPPELSSQDKHIILCLI
jgi:hypothetical protein